MEMASIVENKSNKDTRLYKLVLTGGPCGGKTTGQTRLSTFFENLGWKVFRVPETANVLLCGGVKFAELSEEDCYGFQHNLIRTMMQIEQTYVDLAKGSKKNCLIICDRGVMDATAYMKKTDWDRMKGENGWDEVMLRDGGYNQIIHMVSAAVGAEDFYTCDHGCRSESVELAQQLDALVSEAWVGHPYYDVIDNSTDFEQKCLRMLSSVCQRLGIDFSDRLSTGSKKRKFLIRVMPDDKEFPQYQDFDVVHDYLVTPCSKTQARIRRRGQNGSWTYTHTIRRPEINKQSVELKMAISNRDYHMLVAQRDDKHFTIFKKRRCFLWNNQYLQLDIYQDPCPKRCEGLLLLETYTLKKGDQLELPSFLNVVREVTDEPRYSMFNLSMKEQYAHLKLLNKNFADLSVDYPDDKDAVPRKPQKINANSPSDLKLNGDVFTFNSESGKKTNPGGLSVNGTA